MDENLLKYSKQHSMKSAPYTINVQLGQPQRELKLDRFAQRWSASEYILNWRVWLSMRNPNPIITNIICSIIYCNNILENYLWHLYHWGKETTMQQNYYWSHYSHHIHWYNFDFKIHQAFRNWCFILIFCQFLTWILLMLVMSCKTLKLQTTFEKLHFSKIATLSTITQSVKLAFVFAIVWK